LRAREGTGAGRGRPRLVSAFAGLACFFALMQVGGIALSGAGVRFDRSVAVAVVAVSALLSLLFPFIGRRPQPATGHVTADQPGRQRGTGPLARLVALALLAWAAVVWARLWMLAWQRPPYDWDGLYYHIPAIHEWVRAGRLVWVNNVPDVPWVNYPMGVELNTFLAYQILGTSRLVNACNLWYWPLAVVSLAVIAERLGARGSWRWIAGALVVGAPVFLSQSVSCYIDVGFAITVFASLAAALVFLFDDRHSYWWKGILLGAAVGLMAGAKGTGLPFSFVIVLSVALASLWVRRVPTGGRRRWGIVVAAIVALAVGGGEVQLDRAARLAPADDLVEVLRVQREGAAEQGEADALADAALAGLVVADDGDQASVRDVVEPQGRVLEDVLRPQAIDDHLRAPPARCRGARRSFGRFRTPATGGNREVASKPTARQRLDRTTKMISRSGKRQGAVTC